MRKGVCRRDRRSRASRLAERQACSPVAVETDIYRAVDPKYTDGVLAIHEGNVKANHRYSPPGSGAVYLSTSPEALLGELKRYRISPHKSRIMMGA